MNAPASMNTSVQTAGIGQLPTDWETRRLGDIGSCHIGLTYRPSDISDHGLLVLRATNVQGSRISLDDPVFVRVDVANDLLIRPGDLLICVRNGSKSLIGKCALILDPPRGLTFGAFMAVFRSRSNDFVAHVFQSNIIATQIQERLGATINQITNSSLRSFQIPYPPTEERAAIAAALSDADALISGLDKLIAKKRSIRLSVIQDSFRDSSRRYSRANLEEPVASRRACSEVALVTLREVSKSITVGFVGSMSKLFAKDGVPLLRGQNVQAGRLDFSALKFITTGTHERWSKSRLEPGDVVIVRVGYPGTACTIPAGLGEMNAASLIVVKPNKDLLEPRYLEYFLNSPAGVAQIANSLVGGAQQVLNIGTAARLPVLVPPIREQHNIVSILSDIDAEITALERRRNKTNALKQGMVQQLLTGRIRLLQPEVVA